MPNNCLSVLYKHIIQVENKNVGLKVGGHKHTIASPQSKKWGGHMPPLSPRFLRQCYICNNAHFVNNYTEISYMDIRIQKVAL